MNLIKHCVLFLFYSAKPIVKEDFDQILKEPMEVDDMEVNEEKKALILQLQMQLRNEEMSLLLMKKIRQSQVLAEQAKEAATKEATAKEAAAKDIAAKEAAAKEALAKASLNNSNFQRYVDFIC